MSKEETIQLNPLIDRLIGVKDELLYFKSEYLEYIVVTKEKEYLKLLVDTGLADGLWLFENETINCSANYFKNDKLKKKINKKATQNLSGFLYFLIIETNFDSSLQISKVNS